jgi:dTDP-4-amino-4,6-dideoxygalactose transaminase
MTRQPGFMGLDHGVSEPLSNADRITEAALWVGCHQQLDAPQIDWIAESLHDFLAGSAPAA